MLGEDECSYFWVGVVDMDEDDEEGGANSKKKGGNNISVRDLTEGTESIDGSID